MNTNEIRVPVKDGYLVATRNTDPDYDGISIYFETDNGDMIDIVLTECKAEKNKEEIDVYCYEDVYSEDWTRKFIIGSEEIKSAIN